MGSICLIHDETDQDLSAALEQMRLPLASRAGGGSWFHNADRLGIAATWPLPFQPERNELSIPGLNEKALCIRGGHTWVFCCSDLWLACEGRVFGIHALAEALELPKKLDPALVFYLAWRKDPTLLREHLHGPFSLLALDVKARELYALRDLLGDIQVAFFQSRQLTVLATDPRIIAHHPKIERQPDITSAALWVWNAFDKSKTLFDKIHAARPGALTKFANGKWSLLRQYRLKNPWSSAPKSLDEAAEELRKQLIETVTRYTEGHTRVSSDLSGGMDSASLATIAQRLKTTPVTTVSFVFPNLPPCDESKVFMPLAESMGFHSLKINAEKFPFFYRVDQHLLSQPPTPFFGCYNLFHETLSAAKNAGSTLHLNGSGGDGLFQIPGYTLYWVLEAQRLLRQPSLRKALQFQRKIPKWSYRLFKNLVYFLSPTPLQRLLHPFTLQGKSDYSWLTPKSYRAFQVASHLFKDSAFEGNPGQQYRYDLLFAAGASFNRVIEFYKDLAEKIGMDVAQPYRDEKLSQYSVFLGTDFADYQSETKLCFKQAMKPLFPYPYGKAAGKPTLLEYYNNGIFLHREKMIQAFKSSVLAQHGILCPDKAMQEVLRFQASGQPPLTAQIILAYQMEIWLKSFHPTSA